MVSVVCELDKIIAHNLTQIWHLQLPHIYNMSFFGTLSYLMILINLLLYDRFDVLNDFVIAYLTY